MYEVTGIKKVDYVSKKTGRPVKGYTLWLSYERQDVDGFACDEVYVSIERISEVPQLGDLVNVYYNRFGSVESVVIDRNERGG